MGRPGTPGAHASDPRPAAQAPGLARIAARYAAVAAFCILFAAVYAQFAHGVSSAFMSFMFAVPLALGTLPAMLLRLARRPVPPVVARQAWALAVACLTVASCLRGVFDIAGTASPYLAAYLVAAALLAAVAVASARRFYR